MVIVIEGSNCTGKTTVAKLLAIGHYYIHFPTAKGDIFPGINTTYGELFRQTGNQSYARMDIEANIDAIEAIGNVVVDRFWLSHAVYGNTIPMPLRWKTVILYGSDDLLTDRFATRIKDCAYTEANKITIANQLIANNDKFIEYGNELNITMIKVDGLSPTSIAKMISIC
jgi:deoxyadenosine/deoxycytidine kinase